MNNLTALPNIGKQLQFQLSQAAITSCEDLQAVGSKEAWLRISMFDPSACYMRLCALEGALQGVRWHHLSPAVKEDLKQFYSAHKPSLKE